jgi:hypothetical protein
VGLFNGFKSKAIGLVKVPIDKIQKKYKKLADRYRKSYTEEFTPNPRFIDVDNINDYSLKVIKALSEKSCNYNIKKGKKLDKKQKEHLKKEFKNNRDKAIAQIRKLKEPFKGRNNFSLMKHRCVVIGSWFIFCENLKQNYDLLREAWGIEGNELQIDPKLNIEPEVREKEFKAMSTWQPVQYSLEKFKARCESSLYGIKKVGEELKNVLSTCQPKQDEVKSLLKAQLEKDDVMLDVGQLDERRNTFTHNAGIVYSDVKDNLVQVLYYRMLSCNNITEAQKVYQQHEDMNNVLKGYYDKCTKELGAIRDGENNAQLGVTMISQVYRGQEFFRGLAVREMITHTELTAISEKMSDKVADFMKASNCLVAFAAGLVWDKELRDRCASAQFENILNKVLNEVAKEETTASLPLTQIEEGIGSDAKAVPMGSTEQTENSARKEKGDTGGKEL